MIVKKIEEYGRLSVMEAIHLPVNGKSRGWENHTLKTLIHLINKGDEHGKAERLLQVSLKITAPRYIWSELDTYTIGATPGSSTSTMYTLLKTLEQANSFLSLSDLFEDKVSDRILNQFYDEYLLLRQTYTDDRDMLLNRIKMILPEGFLQTRVRQFSYQTLRRIHKQRKDHRLKWWHDFFDELIPQLNEQELIKKTWYGK